MTTLTFRGHVAVPVPPAWQVQEMVTLDAPDGTRVVVSGMPVPGGWSVKDVADSHAQSLDADLAEVAGAPARPEELFGGRECLFRTGEAGKGEARRTFAFAYACEDGWGYVAAARADGPAAAAGSLEVLRRLTIPALGSQEITPAAAPTPGVATEVSVDWNEVSTSWRRPGLVDVAADAEVFSCDELWALAALAGAKQFPGVTLDVLGGLTSTERRLARDIAARSLLARGMAEVGDDGRIRLGPNADALRAATTPSLQIHVDVESRDVIASSVIAVSAVAAVVVAADPQRAGCCRVTTLSPTDAVGAVLALADVPTRLAPGKAVPLDSAVLAGWRRTGGGEDGPLEAVQRFVRVRAVWRDAGRVVGRDVAWMQSADSCWLLLGDEPPFEAQPTDRDALIAHVLTALPA